MIGQSKKNTHPHNTFTITCKAHPNTQQSMSMCSSTQMMSAHRVCVVYSQPNKNTHTNVVCTRTHTHPLRYYGPAFHTEYRLIVKNVSSRVTWKVRILLPNSQQRVWPLTERQRGPTVAHTNVRVCVRVRSRDTSPRRATKSVPSSPTSRTAI